MAHPFRLYNTLVRDSQPFEPIEAGKVKIYVCGNTVYDHAHVGHARAMVVFDLVVRYLRHRDWDVTFVRNFTDVDDKIINRAKEKGEEPLALAKRFIDAYTEDAEALGLIVPDHEPRVSECIDEITGVIGKLVDNGHAYASEGSVWYSVETFTDYGKLSGQKPDEVQSSADASSGKRNPRDFALWKGSKPGEPSWPSPWGDGRPGWHIECSAMAYKHLGAQIDIHGGGIDLVFPHHENEIAQSEGAHSCAPFSRNWMHNGMLTMTSGQKMGKSLGNVVDIRVALEQFPAEAIRIYYLQVHYRSSLPWNAEALPEALALLARVYDARESAEAMGGEEPLKQVVEGLGADAKTVVELSESFEERFYAAMDDDFNTGKAVGIACELARAINRLANHKKAKKRGGPVATKALSALKVVERALGLLTQTTEEFQAEVAQKRLPALGVTTEDVNSLLKDREDARAAKDWSRADAVRGELEEKGIVIMDRPEGVSWRVRL